MNGEEKSRRGRKGEWEGREKLEDRFLECSGSRKQG